MAVPLTICQVHRAVHTADAKRVVEELGLGRAVLVGNLPPDEGGWAFRTDQNMAILPPAPDGAGLVAENRVWPIRRSRRGSSRDDVVLLGRSRSNDVMVDHATVSKLHARIRLDGDRVILSDAGSSNGTMVNRVSVSGDAALVLESGDTAVFGSVALALFLTPRLIALLRSRERLDGH